MKRIWVLLITLLFLMTITFPIVWWYATPSEPLKVAIIDKTVPDDSYREHNGITWLLNYLKYTNEKGESFTTSKDYFGFIPSKTEVNSDIRPLPKNYDDYDIIYLADTYGVYEDDVPWNKNEREGARSEIIYGGLEEEEWEAIRNRLNQEEKSLLIAEYNTFASPTPTDVTDSVTKYLGIEWSGWTGRFFDELNPELNLEIPQWVVDEFDDEWNYEGPGFIIVNDLNYEVIVLEQDKHINEEGIKLSFTEEGKSFFGLKNSQEYTYWFDIVTPLYGSTVLANYHWNLTDEGKQLLDEREIPIEFAAVVSSVNNQSTSIYFAGDFNDISEIPRLYQFKGLATIYKYGQMFSDHSFYWSTYIPMVQTILNNFSELENLFSPPKGDTTSIQYSARVLEDTYEILINDSWTSIPIKGVNMGMGKPGTYPGEAAITKEEYARWFQQIAEMNANTIRVYTLHPPDFYEALKEHNEKHDEKLHVLHGVWVNEENLFGLGNAFDENIIKEYQEELRTMVDVIHGNKILEEKPGHASGVYRADISEYVIGWVLGVEWDPLMVVKTNELNKDVGDYNGTYFETKNANPFEHWLAQQMDEITTYEIENYNHVRPMSFTNWVTTDILKHPADSTDHEDIVSVDPNVIYTKNEMDLVGQFASYHIYPYYPDFLNYEDKYINYKDHRGENNNYAAYLHDLKEVHRLPILVAEFGVPSSRGKTHENPFGWNQGFLSEKEQGEIISHLYEDIIEADMLGGLVFTWHDEWFKRTWNTMDYDNPDRRPYWSNAQTSEQQFGLLSFDRHKIKVDGNVNEWEQVPLYSKENGPMKAVYVDHDERYLYLRLDYDKESEGAPLFVFDVIPEQGNDYFDKFNINFSNYINFIVDLREDESRVLINRYYDLFTYHYMYQLELVERTSDPPTNNDGEFIDIHYVLNNEYYIPNKDITIPFVTYETGKLKKGNGNPESPEYDSLADYYINESDGFIEIRLPWFLLNAKDPSQKEFMGDMYKDGIESSVFIDELYIGALYVNSDGELIDSFPSLSNEKLSKLKGYSWENWDEPQFEERLKQSYYIIKELYERY